MTEPERRRHQRFKTREGVAALHAGNIGKVNNISLGGISCSCSFVDSPACGKNSHLDIFFGPSADTIHLQNLPIRIVDSDMNLGTSPICLFSRNCRIQFGELTDSQLEHLGEFISRYTET